MTHFRRAGRRLAGALAVGAALAAAPAAAQILDASYQITLGGLSVGAANLRVTVAGEKYDLALSAKLTGLLGAVSGGSGTATAGGALGASGGPLPSQFSLRSSNGKETRIVRMALTGGNVDTFAIEPPLPERPGDGLRVPLAPAHRRGVVDPVSALVMPVKGPASGALDPAACNRSIPVFDGAARFDVVLTYKATQQAAAGTYSGPILVCAVRYRPVAGHRPDRKTTKFMTENKDMEVWLAPVAGSRVLVPLRIAVQTQFGLNVIQAARFNVASSAAAR